MKMSSTLANHYIRPEDLSPLPTTLDAKNSPLALLAQTCSNIGADLLPTSKRLIPPIEKCKKSPIVDRADSVSSLDKNNSMDTRSNSAASVDSKISFKPYETTTTTTTATTTTSSSNNASKKAKSDSCSSSSSSSSSSSTYSNHGIGGGGGGGGIGGSGSSCRSNSVDVISESNKKSTPVSRNQSPSGGSSETSKITSNHHQMTSSSGANSITASASADKLMTSSRCSPCKPNESGNGNSSSNNNNNNSNASNTSSTTASSSINNNISSSSGSSGSTPLLYSSCGLSELSKSQLTPLSKSDSLSTACKTTSSLISCMNGFNNYQGLSPSGAAAAAAAAAAGLLHNDLLKSSPHYSSSLLSPYLNHAHVAAINSMKAAAAAAAAANVCRDPYCKGCQLSASAAAANTGLGASCTNGCNGCVHSSLHTYPLHGSFLQPSPLPSYTTQSNPINSVRPYVCNWTVAGAYCGKSFTNCEELFQHLKSHTNVGGTPFSGLGGYYNPNGLTAGLSSVNSTGAPGAPGSGGGGGGGGSRVTSSHSGLDTLRYHPYGKLGPAVAGVTGPIPSLLSHSGPTGPLSLNAGPLGSYYPSYHMYN